jgi:hypothetical protein
LATVGIEEIGFVLSKTPGQGAVFEAKFMLPWSFSEEAAAENTATTLRPSSSGV